MFRYINPITPEGEAHLRRLAEEEAATITVAGPNGSVVISLNHFDASAVGYMPIGEGVHRRIREAVAEVRQPIPEQHFTGGAST